MKQAAFPSRQFNDRPGMDLRDYFAAKAMQALLRDVIGGSEPNDNTPLIALGVTAYFVADTMLKARDE